MKNEQYIEPVARLVPIGTETSFLVISGKQNVLIEYATEYEWEF